MTSTQPPNQKNRDSTKIPQIKDESSNDEGGLNITMILGVLLLIVLLGAAGGGGGGGSDPTGGITIGVTIP